MGGGTRLHCSVRQGESMAEAVDVSCTEMVGILHGAAQECKGHAPSSSNSTRFLCLQAFDLGTSMVGALHKK